MNGEIIKILLGEYKHLLIYIPIAIFCYWLHRPDVFLVLFVTGLLILLSKKYEQIKELKSIKHIPIAFVIGKSRKEGRNAYEDLKSAISNLTGFSEFEKLGKLFNIDFDDLLIHWEEQFEKPEDWKKYLERARNNIVRYKAEVPGRKIYHVCLYGPVATGFGIGAMFGSNHRVVVYHHDKDKDEYAPVIDLRSDVRRIKQAAKEFRHILKVEYPQRYTENIALILDSPGNKAYGCAVGYVKEKFKEVEIVHVEIEELNPQNSWIRAVQEVFYVFNQLQQRTEVKTIHLFFTIPLALAIGIGMALGNFVPVIVYHHEGCTYSEVLNLREIKPL